VINSWHLWDALQLSRWYDHWIGAGGGLTWAAAVARAPEEVSWGRGGGAGGGAGRGGVILTRDRRPRGERCRASAGRARAVRGRREEFEGLGRGRSWSVCGLSRDELVFLTDVWMGTTIWRLQALGARPARPTGISSTSAGGACRSRPGGFVSRDLPRLGAGVVATASALLRTARASNA